MPRKWTAAELNIIQNSGGDIPVIKGRTRSAVREKMLNLGLTQSLHKRWTQKELALVKRGNLEISGRSKLAVQQMRKKLGLTKDVRWTAAEVQALKNNQPLPGRNKNAVRNKLDRLGLRNKRPDRPDWTEENLNKLKELRDQGYSAKDISEMGTFSCSQNAIQKKLCRLGLVKNIKIVKFPEEIRNKFKKFLLNNWKGKTPEDLAEIWNKENAKYQTNVMRVVSYLTKLNIKIPYGEVQRIKNLRRKEIELNLSNKASANDLLEKIRLERIKIMQERIKKNRDIFTGMPLDFDPQLA
jgi:hypothetical protein